MRKINTQRELSVELFKEFCRKNNIPSNWQNMLLWHAAFNAGVAYSKSANLYPPQNEFRGVVDNALSQIP